MVKKSPRAIAGITSVLLGVVVVVGPHQWHRVLVATALMLAGLVIVGTHAAGQGWSRA